MPGYNPVSIYGTGVTPGYVGPGSSETNVGSCFCSSWLTPTCFFFFTWFFYFGLTRRRYPSFRCQSVLWRVSFREVDDLPGSKSRFGNQAGVLPEDLPLFPTVCGGSASKHLAVSGIEAVAVRTGVSLTTPDGT